MTRTEYEAQHPFGSVNIQDGNTVRPMTAEEWSAWVDQAMEAQVAEQAEADAVAAKEAARASGVAKLEALGLTVDEVSAVFGV